MARQRRRWYLKEWRDHRKLSQEALGGMVGVTQSMISKLELGSTDYTGSLLEKLAKALGCTIYELLFRDPAWPESPIAVIEELPEEDLPFALDMLKTIRRRRGG